MPWQWCEPRESFGDLHATTRVWSKPVLQSRTELPDPLDLAEFRAAIYQNVVSLWIRSYKNATGMTQQNLMDEDSRPQSTSRWNWKLNGRERMNIRDLTVVMSLLPGSLPEEDDVAMFFDVVEFGLAPVPGWHFPDR